MTKMSSSRRVRGPRTPAAVQLLLAAAFVVLAALVLPACRGLEARSGLTNARRSPDAVARAVLEALEARDRAALEGLLLTREEHRDLLWEKLPESNTWPFEYARWLTEHNTRKALTRALERYGGRSFELLEVEFEEEPEVYEDFTLHPGTILWVEEGGGNTGRLELLDVLVERKGGWKPMDYEE